MEIRQKVLQNGYARRLLFPEQSRLSSGTCPAEENAIFMYNIHDNGELWTGKIRFDQIARVEIMNVPLFPGAFHFGTMFYFKDGVKIWNKRNQSKMINGLVMGTGPEKSFSIQGMVGMQVIQMRSYSLEDHNKTSPIEEKFRHEVNPRKIDISRFFMAHAEEAARLAAMTNLRALKAEAPKTADHILFQKYNVFGANCVSSGIQNLTRSVQPRFQKLFLRLGKKDISEVPEISNSKFSYWIKSWNKVSIQALRAIAGRSPDQNSFQELELFHKHLRRTNQMSLPWRAKVLIDWATTR